MITNDIVILSKSILIEYCNYCNLKFLRPFYAFNIHLCVVLSLPIGIFSLGVPVDALFFIGNQLVATSHTGKVGVWNAVTQHWQVHMNRVSPVPY